MCIGEYSSILNDVRVDKGIYIVRVDKLYCW